MYHLFFTFIILISFSHSLAQCQPGSRTLFHSHYQVVWDQNLNGATFYRLVGGYNVIMLQKERGIYEFVWNGTDSENLPVNSGLYIVNIRTDIEVLSEKILLLK